MSNVPFYPTDILLAQNTDMKKWSVVACDQYTSQPDYWQRVKNFVGSGKSTLNITLPEIYLNDKNVEERITGINSNMAEMLSDGTFKTLANSIVYIERTLDDGKKRCGIIGAVDLEEYSYEKGSQSKIRATEGTILERIPPRVKVRRNAPIELPHIMLLIDDREKSVIEPLEKSAVNINPVYDFELMENGGSIRGYSLDSEQKSNVLNALNKLCDQKDFDEKYGVSGKGVLVFAVGDGNHSLATAKASYEELKKTMSREEYLSHPARYALAEIVNLHSDALLFEPIHRIVFDVDTDKLEKSLKEYFELGSEKDFDQSFELITKTKNESIFIKNPSCNLAVGSLQSFLDKYLKENGGEIDYIHGSEVISELCRKDNHIGLLLPAMEKNDLFKTVILDGALPRKTFSMGHSQDKRFYLECRKIK